MMYRVLATATVTIDTVIEADTVQEALLAAQTEALNGAGEIEWTYANVEAKVLDNP